MIKINQVKIKVNHTEEQLKKKTAEILQIAPTELLRVEINRQSIDARKKPEIFYTYTLLAEVKDEKKVLDKLKKKKGTDIHQIMTVKQEPYHFPAGGEISQEARQKSRTVIVGTGPAGLFCGYFLALHGLRPILLERGKDVDQRQKDVDAFWTTGKLNPASNVQFGEGGAGTFSDGKLNTLVKDKDGRNRAVLETFVKFGAKPSIVYEAKPHIGTDVLKNVVKNMREEIIRMGGEVWFESQMTDILTENGRVSGVIINQTKELLCEKLVLATGHSARDTFAMLFDKKIPMEAKAFAVGFRVEHPQRMIDKSQYGMDEPGSLGAAPYKVTAQTVTGRGVYSFCMCPGGYVVNASSEEGRLAVNGMSYSGRDGKNANSAIIVAVTPQDYGSDHPLAGISFQRKLEEKAFAAGKGCIPVQRFGIFKQCVEEGKRQEELNLTEEEISMPDSFQPCCKGAFQWADLTSILPAECNQAFVEGMESFNRQIRDFSRADAVLLGVESRTSSPVRVHRDETLQSELRGLYPCGEGAGYAGGITSAAMDGIRVAEMIIDAAEKVG